MTEWTRVLESSWKELCELYKESKFNPRTEADVQSLLYHLCIQNYSGRGAPYKKIHVGTTYPDSNRRVDLQLGHSYVVEIKLRTPRDWSKDPGWFGDIIKESSILRRSANRIPVVAVLFRNGPTMHHIEKLEAYRLRAWKDYHVRLIYGGRSAVRFWSKEQ